MHRWPARRAGLESGRPLSHRLRSAPERIAITGTGIPCVRRTVLATRTGPPRRTLMDVAGGTPPYPNRPLWRGGGGPPPPPFGGGGGGPPPPPPTPLLGGGDPRPTP